jgi:hypothetical protein
MIFCQSKALEQMKTLKKVLAFADEPVSTSVLTFRTFVGIKPYKVKSVLIKKIFSVLNYKHL